MGVVWFAPALTRAVFPRVRVTLQTTLVPSPTCIYAFNLLPVDFQLSTATRRARAHHHAASYPTRFRGNDESGDDIGSSSSEEELYIKYALEDSNNDGWELVLGRLALAVPYCEQEGYIHYKKRGALHAR